MKKQLIAIASVAMLAGVVTFSSCKKDDTTAPSLTITGGNTQSQSLPATAGNGTYTYPTVTASDDVDGDLTSSVTYTGTVDPNTKGTYTLTYTVSDAAGNAASEVVTVSIVNDAEYAAGDYNVVDVVPAAGTYYYTMNITTSSTENGKILFHTGIESVLQHTVGFADYENNTNIYALISGTTVTLPSQTALGIGQASESHTFLGNGTVTQMTAPVTFNITYNDVNNTTGTPANGCVQTYPHQ